MIVFTRHAEMRYARRIRSDVALSAVAAQGRIQAGAPGILAIGQPADAYLVHGEAVFPLLRRGDDEWVAVTCIRRHRLSKADRRARRELAHADWIEAA